MYDQRENPPPGSVIICGEDDGHCWWKIGTDDYVISLDGWENGAWLQFNVSFEDSAKKAIWTKGDLSHKIAADDFIKNMETFIAELKRNKRMHENDLKQAAEYAKEEAEKLARSNGKRYK